MTQSGSSVSFIPRKSERDFEPSACCATIASITSKASIAASWIVKTGSPILETPYRYDLAALEMEYRWHDRQRVRCSQNPKSIRLCFLQRLHAHSLSIHVSSRLLGKPHCICRSP